MSLKDYYNILEVTPTASLLVIKKAYRKLAHKYHPDKNNYLSEEEKQQLARKFQQIKEAYETIKAQKK